MKHEAGRTAALHQVKHWFLDLDGTTYLGDTPLPGALAFVHHLRRHGIGYTFLTNNSSKSASEYGDKLQRLGFPVSEQRVFSSARATGRYLQQQLPGARVFLLGTSSFAAELGSFGVDLVEEHADTVVLGYDTFLTYPRLATACRLLAAGARYIASHPDINCPSPQGPLPDAGAVMALLAASTGRQPDTIVGKPSVRFLHEAAEQAGVALSDCGMIGDRLETDIEMALTARIPAVLVFSGVTTPADLARAGSRGAQGIFPTDNLGALLAALEERSTPAPGAE